MKKPSLVIGIGASPKVGPVPPDTGPDAAPDAPDSGDDSRMLYVPLESLATPDNSEQMQTPEVGDTGQMQVTYIVKSVEGDQACIEPTAINGKDLPTKDDTESAPQDDTDNEGMSQETSDMGDQLRQQATQMS